MLLGKVVGTVVSTRKDPKIEGLRFMIVKQIDVEGVETGNYIIAVDAVGSGVGETVLYATGSSARQTVLTDRRPIDGVIMAIVDMWEVGGAIKYHKYREVGEGDEA